MKKLLASLGYATLLVGAAPYSDAQLANGFAQFVVTGRDVSPLMSTAMSEDVAAQLKLLSGCKVTSVDSLNAKFVGYGVEWKCRQKAKGVKTAAIIKIADGLIYQVMMSDVL